VDDFASAVLVAVVRQALAEDAAGDAGTAAAPGMPVDALLPLEDKRRLLDGVAAASGLLPLLRVGRVIPRFPSSHPVVSALRRAEGPQDLFARWSRLERFAHSRHQVLVQHAGPSELTAEHVGPPQAPPGPAEDAVVLGLLTGLLQDIGVRGLTVVLEPDAVVLTEGRWTAPPAGHPTARWRFRWASLGPPAHAGTRAREGGADPPARARELLLADPTRRWTVGHLADRCGVAPRSLQRQLRSAGGFASLLGTVRAEQAAELLVGTDHPLGAVGFACGYADQPHFTRAFRRRTAMTPAAYRAAFTPSVRRGPVRAGDPRKDDPS
jgi:AraC-like DNA-binding protein